MFFYCLCSIALFAAVSPFVFSTIVLSALVVLGLVHEQSAPVEASCTNPIVVEFILGMCVAKLTQWRARAHTLVSCAMIAAGASLILLAEPDPTLSRPLTWGLPAALIVLGAAQLEGALRKLPRVLLLLGDSSYSLYLVHTFVVPVVGLVLMRSGWANPWMVLVTAAAVSAGVSVAVHKLIERPMTDKLKQFLPAQFRYGESTLLRERENI
jgi:exopolysaccharide production protein ExoZ